ncbi:MAG: NADH:flavin oxidoreductase, partial [Cyanobacteriota bacterium]
SLIADEINIPVILVGGNRTPDLMNEILNTTNIQYFSMSRVLLCQPDMVNIWIKNPNEIPECKSCNRCFSKEGNICSLKRSKITTIT